MQTINHRSEMKMIHKTKDNKLLLGFSIVLLLTVNYVGSIFINQHLTDITAYDSIGFWLVVLNFTLMTLIVLGYKKYANLPWRDLGLGKPKNWWQPILIFITLYFAFNLFARYISPEIVKLGDRPNISHLMNLPGNFQGLVISLILIWITAAFLEEFIFRGFLLNAIDTLLGRTNWSMWVSVVISSVIFGLIHAYQGITGILITGSIGFIFGIAFVINGRRLWPLILMHGLIDTISFISIYQMEPM